MEIDLPRGQGEATLSYRGAHTPYRSRKMQAEGLKFVINYIEYVSLMCSTLVWTPPQGCVERK